MSNIDNDKGSRKCRCCKDNENGSSIAKKSIEDCDFCLGSNNKPLDYEETKDCTINDIKKTRTLGNCVAESLRKETKIDTPTQKPIMEASTKADADEKATENE